MNAARFWVYVIELDRPEKVYVGSSAFPPAERFARHKRGGRTTSRYVHKQGTRLRPDLYAHLKQPLLSREAAHAAERQLRSRLMGRGFQVFGSGCLHPREDGCFGI